MSHQDRALYQMTHLKMQINRLQQRLIDEKKRNQLLRKKIRSTDNEEQKNDMETMYDRYEQQLQEKQTMMETLKQQIDANLQISSERSNTIKELSAMLKGNKYCNYIFTVINVVGFVLWVSVCLSHQYETVIPTVDYSNRNETLFQEKEKLTHFYNNCTKRQYQFIDMLEQSRLEKQLITEAKNGEYETLHERYTTMQSRWSHAYDALQASTTTHALYLNNTIKKKQDIIKTLQSQLLFRQTNENITRNETKHELINNTSNHTSNEINDHYTGNVFEKTTCTPIIIWRNKSTDLTHCNSSNLNTSLEQYPSAIRSPLASNMLQDTLHVIALITTMVGIFAAILKNLKPELGTVMETGDTWNSDDIDLFPSVESISNATQTLPTYETNASKNIQHQLQFKKWYRLCGSKRLVSAWDWS